MGIEFKSFYFLHIPKTGGRIFRANIIDQIYRDIKNTNIKPIYSVATAEDNWTNRFTPAATHIHDNTTKNKNDIQDDGHAGWKKSIDNNTYVVSIFREPLKQSVSLFAHIYDTNIGNINDKGVRVKETDLSKISKEDYLNWFTKNTQNHNFQIKNFIVSDLEHWIEIEKEFINEKNRGEDKNSLFGTKIAMDRIKRVNLLIDEEHLTNIGMQRAYDKICEDLKIKPSQLEFLDDSKIFKNDLSSYIYDQLIPEEKNILKKMLALDYKVYEDRSLFTDLLVDRR